MRSTLHIRGQILQVSAVINFFAYLFISVLYKEIKKISSILAVGVAFLP